MFDDLAAYYHEHVVSSYEEYRDARDDGTSGRSRDLRAALNAASALFHLREHLPGNVPSRANIELACPDFALLGDVVNASKHKILTAPTSHGAPLVATALSLAERVLIVEYVDEAGAYRYSQKAVIVRLVDGSERNLLEVLTSVLNFWEEKMNLLGVLPKARIFSDDSAVRFRSRGECSECSIKLEITPGLRFHQTFQYFRFDNATGIATPVDLTGANAELHVRQPSCVIELSLTLDASGKTHSTEVTLSEQQSRTLQLISSEEDREEFLNSLPQIQAAFQQLASETGVTKQE
jgi:hypothetical protein